MLGFKFFMRFFIIGAYAYNIKALGQHRLVIIPETTGLGSTPGVSSFG